MVEASGESKNGLLAQALRYWRMVLRWKWLAILFFIGTFSAVAMYSFMQTPIFTAHGSVWIEDDPKILPFEDIQTFGAGTTLQSHARLLQSRTLAADTIEKLKLYENPDFAGRLDEKGPPRDPNDPVFRERLVIAFLNNITVNSVQGTRLVDVSFSNRNPKLAAEILNALFDGYIDMMVRKRYSTSEQATEFLDTQINELRTEIEQRERELNKLGSEKDILPLTAAEAPAVTRIADVNRALTEATIDRINKLNAYNQLRNAPLGEIPNVPEGSLIGRLREQYIALSRQYATRSATVRPEYPEMRRIKSELDSATEALQNETQNLIRTAYNDYLTALSREQSLQKLLEKEKNEAYQAKSDSVIYNSLRIELENRKALLESLSKRKSETDVASRLRGLEALNVWIVDRADLPLNPAFPNKRKNVLMGFMVGLAGGVGLALGLEYLNNSVKTSKDVAAATGLPTIGTIPAFEKADEGDGPLAEIKRLTALLKGKARPEKPKKQKRRRKGDSPAWLLNAKGEKEGAANYNNSSIDLIASKEPNSIQAESFRSIRTTLLVSSPPGRIKSIAVTSPLAQEGKSSVVSNLGITLAQANKQVVIVDADLRKPKQHAIFELGRGGKDWGLTSYLSSYIKETEVIKSTHFPNLFVIGSGPIPANPIELLASEKMDALIAALKKNFDFILLDTPPLLAVSDTLAMGPMMDGVVLVARAGETPIPALKQAKLKLDTHKLKCLGVILNGVDLVEQDGYYAKQYYHYSRAE
jgi:polysaccharide biosynthesis transport protein